MLHGTCRANCGYWREGYLFKVLGGFYKYFQTSDGKISILEVKRKILNY